MCDIITEQIQKQIQESNCLPVSQTLRRFTKTYKHKVSLPTNLFSVLENTAIFHNNWYLCYIYNGFNIFK